MKIEINVYDHKLMDADDLDDQIVQDFTEFISEVEQMRERLGEVVKEQDPESYPKFSELAENKLNYARRIIECIELVHKNKLYT